MKKARLQFSSIVDMIDFETEIRTFGSNRDYHNYILSGFFTEAQIELAKAGYDALVEEESE